MELKYALYFVKGFFAWVLIVPLWNWNNVTSKKVKTLSCFNRTFMELKLSDRLVTEETEGLF